MRAIWLAPLPALAATLAALPPPRALSAPVELVRIFGGPTDQAGRHAVRVDCLERRGDRESFAARRAFRLTVAGETYGAACDAFGSVEVPIVLRGGAAPVDVMVTTPWTFLRRPALLAEGSVALSASRARAGREVRSARLAGTSEGAEMEAFLPGGVLPVGATAVAFVRVRSPGAPHHGLACAGDGDPLAIPTTAEPPRPVHAWGDGVSAHSIGQACGPQGYPVGLGAQATSGSFFFTPSDRSPSEWGHHAMVPVIHAPSARARMSADGNRLLVQVRSALGRSRAHLRIDDDGGRRQAAWVTLQRVRWLASDGEPASPAFIAQEPFPLTTKAELELPVDFDRAANPVLVVADDDQPNTPSHAVSLRGDPLGPTWSDAARAGVDPSTDLVVTPTLLWVDGLPQGIASAASRALDIRAQTGLGYLVVALAELLLLGVWRRSRRLLPASR